MAYHHPSEIVERIIEDSKAPYRPCVTDAGVSTDLIELMTACWNDDPEKRPSFRVIREDFRGLNKGRLESVR